MTSEQNQRLQAAVAALRLREFARAAELLRTLAHDLPSSEMPWELLANAEAALGNRAEAVSALDERLELDIRDVPALLLKGQFLEQDGDSRGAASHYRAAINQFAVSGSCPPQLRPLLAHGEAFIDKTKDRYADYLHDTVGTAPTARLAMALEMMTGKREVFLQQPSVFYFPELPQRQFYEPGEFPWLEPMLDRLPEMQVELDAVESDSAMRDFEPYVTRDANRPAPNNPLLDDPAWGAFYFWKGGERIEANAVRCPATMAALEHAPMPRIDARSPVALWSRLKPGAHIQPHHGMLNTRLICHIPIRTAPRCTLRVGNEVREWLDGIPLIFDDSIEHEARNAGDQSRTVLLFEIWRPEISDVERAALTQLFSKIAAYSE